MSSLGRDVATAAAPTAKGAGASAWARAALRVLATLVAVSVAAALGWYAWQAYMATPWTRDGTVRAYVVTIAPDVAGQIVDLPLRDNQFVHKGDLLMQIDPASYAVAVQQAEAQVAQAKAVAQNAEAEWERRQKLNNLAVTVEEQQTYASQSLSARAGYQLQLANLANARLNLKRTRIVSPVNGYVTNLLARAGDYANVGERQVSVVDADSYWVDGYFEETFLERIQDGDPASVKLLGYPQILRGHVQSVARGISVANASPSASGLATVNPIFAFVRLAQRVPVRIQLDAVSSDVRLVAGMTATVEIDSGQRRAAVSNAATTAKTREYAAEPASPPAPAAIPVPAPAAGEPTPSGFAAAAEAILPRLPAAADATNGSGAAPSKSSAPAVQGSAEAATSPASPPRDASADAATTEANEILSDKAFDSSLNIEGPTSLDQPRRAPNTLLRRGRAWRHRERQ
ncbi:MAG TPA: efflux RND transporter periplasmic adaptor subunit [Roseiarcus sp.]|nr:efflux RND transporter periplasmic adaptor subunit [Roseiarcus sp.]